MKKFSSLTNKNEILRSFVVFAFLVFSVVAFADGGTHPGTDPQGMSVPVDGGILMALLAGGSLLTVFLRKKKKDE